MIGNLHAIGIIDRDFHTDEYLGATPDGMFVLPYHEVESLYCLPRVVAAAAAHTQKPFNDAGYVGRMGESVTVAERQQAVLERWKRRVEPQLTGVIAGVHSRQDSLETIIAALPQLFDSSKWDFDPAGMMEGERARVERAATSGTVEDLLRVLQGKGRLGIAAQVVGLPVDDYMNLVNRSLRGVEGLEILGAAVEAALVPHLPPRHLPQG
jgi:hypothetical protein